MAPGTWTDENEKLLLLAMIHITGATLSKSRWNEVSALMGDGGNGQPAYRQFIKLRNDAQAKWGTPAAGTDGETAAKTPAKKASKRAPGGTGKAGSKRKAKEAVSEEGGEDDEEETPAKKAKTVVKGEEDDDDERL